MAADPRGEYRWNFGSNGFRRVQKCRASRFTFRRDIRRRSQAARSGHKEIIEILMEHGVDIYERTDHGTGQTVLDLAYDHHDEDSSFVNWILEIADWGDDDEAEQEF